ncbi:helix-turn-helix transcriptional regulator [Candidatus Bipolaricaulota bacterium]|nr:helix-turn-helix transcriptional regulator [Candidatus Bipolaricaulota bacterium]
MDLKSPVKIIRDKVDVPQRKFAKAVNVNTSVISRFEMGEANIENNEDALRTIAEYANIDPETLIEQQRDFQKRKEEKESEEIREKMGEMEFDEFE